MNTILYNQKGESIGTAKLPERIFDVPWNADLMYQVVVSQMGNRRRVIAHTKGRGAVSGGGRKPWAQKGLGRARQGSIRAPQWRKGGVVFGPRNTIVFTRDIPQNMKRKALCIALSAKARDKEVLVLEDLPQEYAKTKMFYTLLSKLPVGKKTILFAFPQKAGFLRNASKNISSLHVIPVKGLNALDLFSSKFFMTTKEGMEELEKTFTARKPHGIV